MTTITSYATLTSALQDWLDGAESVASHPDQMIFLAEAYFRRNILNHDREGTATLTASSATVTLPTDFLQARSAYVDRDPIQTLREVSPGALRQHFDPAHSGCPMEYALEAGAMIVGPTPDATYSIKLTYARSLAGLSASNTTNWLIEDHPDVYLLGAMMHGELYASNDNRASTLKGAVDQIIDDINAEGNRKRSGGTIRMGSGVRERL